MENQVVIFRVGNELYGVDIASVESIIKMQAITAVPHAPQFVEGVTNLRGIILPVIDLRKRFGLSQVEETKDSRIIVVAMDGTKLGMVVDAVSEVLSIPEGTVEPPSPLVSTVDTAFISGIAKLDGRLVILVNLEKIFSRVEKEELQSGLESA
jgi:purine-binding chemotaxis protein CheW